MPRAHASSGEVLPSVGLGLFLLLYLTHQALQGSLFSKTNNYQLEPSITPILARYLWGKCVASRHDRLLRVFPPSPTSNHHDRSGQDCVRLVLSSQINKDAYICDRQTSPRPSYYTLIRLTQDAILPDSPQVVRVVNIFHRISLHQHQISFQSDFDLSAVCESETFRGEVGSSS